jgi:uncharacterized protein (TIGR01777 family)
METVLITGGTGLIGRHLSKRLTGLGFSVSILSSGTKPVGNYETYFWDYHTGKVDPEIISKANYIIHLAGANIGEKRWTKSRKQEIIDSRVKSAELIYNCLKDKPNVCKAFISASAVGYYGSVTSEKTFTETDSPSSDFLGTVCQLWESAADKFEELGIRTVKIRTGVVLTSKGGALAKIALPVKFGIGSAIGNGKQYMPWVHIDDLCDIYIKAIEDTHIQGAYNAVAPEHLTNIDFLKTLSEVLHKPFWFPKIPGFVLKIVFGEMSEMLLNGSRISSEKISATGFTFSYPKLREAFIHIIKNQ